ncbi:MAG: DedA family protein [Bacteroidaceae bacterium]
MPQDLVYFISHYGYLAVFLLIFLQEIGAPIPLPNELLLIFSGYLASTGILNFWEILGAAIIGDLLAGTVVYLVFYLFGNLILQKAPRWLPLPRKMIKKQSERLEKMKFSGLCIARLTPFIRGYIAVICGLWHVKPRRYATAVLLTTILWSSVYLTTGYLLGPYWIYIETNIDVFKYLFLALPIGIGLWLLTKNTIHLINSKNVTKSFNIKEI